MGGGDLNLKKSWHPHTLKNQEKVWKAKQAKNDEERKLNDLRKEIKQERELDELKRIGESSGVLDKTNSNSKLEWMYKNGSELINREEYLLGRKIDKSFEVLQAEEQQKEQVAIGVKRPINHVEHECIPFSIRDYRNNQSMEQVDLQRKTMEDPLMLIKQREMESRRKLLENPVKLKEIHRILKTDVRLKNTKKSKRAKKHKKRNKDSNIDTDESENDKELDKELEKRYKKLKGVAGSDLNLSKLLDAKYRTISKELDKATMKKITEKSRKSSCRCSSSSNSSDTGSISTTNSSQSESKDKKTSRKQANDHKDYNSKSKDDVSTKRRNNQTDQRPNDERSKRQNSLNINKHDRSSTMKSYRKSHSSNRHNDYNHTDGKYSQNIRRERSRSRNRYSPAASLSRRRSRSKQKCRTPTPTDKQQSTYQRKSSTATCTKKPKLTDAERAARLREMVENATWREADRAQVVNKHREAYAREEAQYKSHDFDKEFINKEVKKAIANQSTIGTRIRANLNNIQRNSDAMDFNFARK